MVLSEHVVQYSGAGAPVPALASTVARALESYEPWRWSFGDYSAAPCSLWLLERRICSMLLQNPTVAFAVPMCDGDETGAAAVGFLVRCPTAAAPSSPPLLEKLTLVWNLEPRIALKHKEYNGVAHEMHERDAADVGEHYMVSLVGVLPHMQGKGLARRLLQAMLQTADADGLPVYLITGNDRNEAMYARDAPQ